jgi:hypothetical protein
VTVGVKVKLKDDWAKFLKKSNPRLFRVILWERMQVAMVDNCEYLEKVIATRIRRIDYKRNKPLTVLLKGSGVPLVDNADMIKSLSHLLESPFDAYVGVNKNAAKGANIAYVLHEGWTIRVTPAMRRWMAIAIAKALKSGKTFATKPVPFSSAAAIVIPPRPFIKKVIDDKRIQGRILRRWAQAYAETFATMSMRIT